MFRFKHGCYVDTGDASTGGGEPAPAVDATPVETAPAAESAPKADYTREDFAKNAPFLRASKASQSPEPDAKAVEGETPDTPAEEPAKEAEAKEVKPPEPELYDLPDGSKVTLEDLKKGHLMHKDYTTKTQSLAEERRQMAERERQLNEQYGAYIQRKKDYDDAIALRDAIGEDPVGVLTKLQEHYAGLGIFDAKDPEVLKQERIARQIDFEKQQLTQDKQSLAAERQAQQVESIRAGMEARLTALEQEHGDNFDREEVVKFMIENNLYDVDKCFQAVAAPKYLAKIKELEASVKTAKDTGVKEYVKQKTSKGQAAPPVGAGASGAAPVTITKPHTLQDAKKAALARVSAILSG
jgi:hypothetical protein